MNSNVENLPPHVLRLVYKEVSALAADPPEGIKVYPSEEDITELHTSIEGPEGTPFAGGIFRMRLVLGKDFPAVPPKGYFLTKIFHPNVGHKGEICVNVLKRDWKAELGLRHVLLVRCTPPCSYNKCQTLLQHLSLQLISFIPPTDNQVSSHPSQPGVRPQRGGRAVTVRGLCRIRVSSSTAHGDPRHGWSRGNLRGTSGPKRRSATKEARG
uniref:Ubiquitin-conjugating enzyme E2S n=1 Tax=Takifugu rubripes TaxID=31033 RepID=A0A674MWY3_TAKRU